MPESFSQDNYAFDLPEELIAQDPPLRRGDSRLMLVEPGQGVVGERVFREIPGILRSGDLLVLNESRVLPARLMTVREDTGGQVEILLIRPTAGEKSWLALARPQRRLRPGLRLVLQGAGNDQPIEPPVLEIVERREQGEVVVTAGEDPGIMAERFGVMPLPPYIKRGREDFLSERGVRDRDRYQTVFAARDESGAGSVAAPTAGLHFSEDILAVLADRGIDSARVSLHVGPGTFRPPSIEQMALRRLHRESFHLSAATSAAIVRTREAGGRVIAVGTTSLRVLETVARLGLSDTGPDCREFPAPADGTVPEFCGEAVRKNGAWDVAGQTRLFLGPPDKVTAVDGLLTNFHLPGSSLLMLVAALAGEKTWPGVYDTAVQRGMRFYSYGDCMLILPGLSGLKGS